MDVSNIAIVVADLVIITGATTQLVILFVRAKVGMADKAASLPEFFEYLTKEDRDWLRDFGADWLPEEDVPEESPPKNSSDLDIRALPWEDGHEHVREITAAEIRRMSPSDYERYRPWLLNSASPQYHQPITSIELSESQATVWESRG